LYTTPLAQSNISAELSSETPPIDDNDFNDLFSNNSNSEKIFSKIYNKKKNPL
jgi:hypothetical protein